MDPFLKISNHDLRTSSKIILSSKYLSFKKLLRGYGYYVYKAFPRKLIIDLEKSVPITIFDNQYPDYFTTLNNLFQIYHVDHILIKDFLDRVLVHSFAMEYHTDNFHIKTYIGLVEVIFSIKASKLALQSLLKFLEQEKGIDRGYIRQMVLVNHKLYLHVSLL